MTFKKTLCVFYIGISSSFLTAASETPRGEISSIIANYFKNYADKQEEEDPLSSLPRKRRRTTEEKENQDPQKKQKAKGLRRRTRHSSDSSFRFGHGPTGPQIHGTPLTGRYLYGERSTRANPSSSSIDHNIEENTHSHVYLLIPARHGPLRGLTRLDFSNRVLSREELTGALAFFTRELRSLDAFRRLYQDRVLALYIGETENQRRYQGHWRELENKNNRGRKAKALFGNKREYDHEDLFYQALILNIHPSQRRLVEAILFQITGSHLFGANEKGAGQFTEEAEEIWEDIKKLLPENCKEYPTGKSFEDDTDDDFGPKNFAWKSISPLTLVMGGGLLLQNQG